MSTTHATAEHAEAFNLGWHIALDPDNSWGADACRDEDHANPRDNSLEARDARSMFVGRVRHLLHHDLFRYPVPHPIIDHHEPRTGRIGAERKPPVPVGSSLLECVLPVGR